MSKLLGIEISEDGATAWRINGGSTERRALYAEQARWETVGGKAPQTTAELKAFCDEGNFSFAERHVARIFQEPPGLYYICDDGLDCLDARGTGYRTKSEALRTAALSYTHATGSGCSWKGVKSIESFLA